ncbi:hypothetical protein J6590_068382 [Homalodisca vitripennis]|nr:hypothetical protein J6590_068382 [Homalodisca vitripennis]
MCRDRKQYKPYDIITHQCLYERVVYRRGAPTSHCHHGKLRRLVDYLNEIICLAPRRMPLKKVGGLRTEARLRFHFCICSPNTSKRIIKLRDWLATPAGATTASTSENSGPAKGYTEGSDLGTESAENRGITNSSFALVEWNHRTTRVYSGLKTTTLKESYYRQASYYSLDKSRMVQLQNPLEVPVRWCHGKTGQGLEHLFHSFLIFILECFCVQNLLHLIKFTFSPPRNK